MSNTSIIENIHKLLAEKYNSRNKRTDFPAATFLSILLILAAMAISTESTYAASRSMNVNEWLYQCRSICTKISKEKAVYSSKGCPTAYFDKKFTRSRYHGKTRLHCADYASWCLQRYKIIPAGQRFWVRGQKVKGVNGKGTKFITKNKKIQRIMIAKKGVPASVLVKRTGTKSLKKGDLVSVVRKSGSGNHIQIYAGKQNGKMIFYMVSSITTTNGKGTPLVLSKMTNTSRDPYSKDPRIAMILRIKGLNYTDYFKVTTSAGGHGTVGKTRNVKWGGSTAVEITPETGYRIGTVKLNGKTVKVSKTAASYTIRNIKKSQKLEVTFEKIPGYTKPPEQETPDSTNKNNQNGSSGAVEAAKNAEAGSMNESEESKGSKTVSGYSTEGRNETGSEDSEASTAAGKDSAAE